MRPRLAPLVLVPAVLLGTALAATPASAAPAGPTGLTQFAAIGGVGLTWTAPSGAVTGYHVFRDGTQIADVTDLTAPLTTIDTDIASGAAADYTVTAYDDSGDSAPASLHATRPATDPTLGTTDAFVLDGFNRHFFMDAARTGDGVTLSADVLTGAVGGVQRGTSTLPVVPGPGTYPTGPNGMKLDVNVDGFACPSFVGTLTVREAAFDADLHPITYAAELTGTCNSYRVDAALRWDSGVPYVAALTSPDSLAPQADPATSTDATVTLTNKGLSDLAIGTPAVTGEHAAEYTADATACGTALQADASCDVTVHFTPTAYGTRAASLDLPVGDQHRTVALAGIGGRLPGPVTNVSDSRGYHRTLLTWSPPADLGNPSTLTYRVYATEAGTPWTSFTTVTGPSYLDTAAVPGRSTIYRIVAENAAGPGEAYVTNAQVNPTRAVLEVSAGPGGTPGLYQLVTDSKRPTVRIPFLADSTPRITPVASPDGTKVAYAQRTGSSFDLWVANTDGTGTPVRLTSLAADEAEPAWSPDGSTIAFTYATDTTVEVRTVPAAGGTSVRRALGYEHPSFLADGSRLVADNADNEGLATLDAAGRATAIRGSDFGYSPSVSPDGTQVAYVLDSDSGTQLLATLPVTGGTPVVVNDSSDWDNPAWMPNGHYVYGERYVGNAQDGQLSFVSWNPTALSQPAAVTSDANDAWPAFVGPKLQLASFGAVTGRTVSFSFTTPDFQTRCALDGGTETSCTSPYTATGLAAGAHRLVVHSVAYRDGMLDSVAAAAFTVDATAPALTVVTGTGGSTASTVAFSYRATDATAGVQSYDVRYRKASSNGAYSAYTSPAGWLGTTATSRSLTATPGYEYCFSVRVRDRVGNTTGWTSDRCVDVALDDRSLVASSGWTRTTQSGAYRSTVTVTKKTGTSLSLRAVQTKRVMLVVTKCSTCGQVAVYVGSTKVGVVDTRSTTTQRAVRVALPVMSTVRAGALVLRPLQAGRQVIVDGVALGRS